jgi:hypothetical protein
MAYTLTDQFRPLRLVMRINGTVIGLLLGLCLLLSSQTTLGNWGIYTTGLLWPTRLAGALLCALGVLLILAAAQREIDTFVLLTMLMAHTMLVLVMLLAYFQQEFSAITWGGRVIFVLIFLLGLIGAITPLRYWQAGYRM